MLSSSLFWDLFCSLTCKSFCINVHMVLSYSSPKKKYKKMFVLTSFVSHLKSRKK